jgi:hypothetical protein
MRLAGISYCPSTGVISRHGKPRNATNSRGYKVIKIEDKYLYQHRVAWYLTYGFWPDAIDHINRDKSDNRLINLRACTRSTNSLNRNLNSNNTSGVRGVCYDKATKKWIVQYKSKTIGRYPTFQQAKEVANELVGRS